jgi:hypothetical protein
MKQQMIGNVVNGVLRKKLEERVLDIMDHPEDVPEDILDNLKLAKDRGFKDIVSGFNEIFSEVGKIQVERTIQKKKNKIIKRKEKEFQDYLITHPEKLEELENGLKFLASEKNIRSGRLDIAAKDNELRDTKVELKARDSDSRNNYMQIMKYLNDDKEKNGRLFFVAPEIKADLFFALKQQIDSGQIKLFEHNFKGDDNFSFNQIQEDNYEVPREIDWSKRKRKKQDNGLVRVTAAVGQSNGNNDGLNRKKNQEDNLDQKIEVKVKPEPVIDKRTPEVSEVIEKDVFSHLENGPLKIPISKKSNEKALTMHVNGLENPDSPGLTVSGFKGEEKRDVVKISARETQIEKGLENYPYYYQVIDANIENPKDMDKYTQKVKVTKSQRDSLLLLLEEDQRPIRFEESTDPVINISEIRGNLRSLKINNFETFLKKIYAISNYSQLFRESYKTIDRDWGAGVLDDDSPEPVNGVIQEMKIDFKSTLQSKKEIQKDLEKTINSVKDVDGNLVDIKYILSDILRGPNLNYEVKENIGSFLEAIKYPAEAYLNEFLKTKIKRAEELFKVDRNLGIGYLLFSPDMGLALDNGSNEGSSPQEDNERFKHIFSFINYDHKVYYELFNLLTVGFDPKKQEISKNKKKELESLIETPILKMRFKDYNDELLPNKGSLGKKELLKLTHGNREGEILEEGIDSIYQIYGKFEEMDDVVLNYLIRPQDIGQNINIKELEVFDGTFKETLNKLDRGMDKTSRKLRKVRNKLKRLAKNNPTSTQVIDKYMNFSEQRLLSEFLDLKIKRAKELRKIDYEVSQDYLTHQIVPEDIGLSKKVLDNIENENKTNINLKKFILKDTEDYQNIISQFKVKPEPSKLEIKVEQKPSKPTPPKPKIPTYMEAKSIKNNLISKHKYLVSEDSISRIDYFVEDVLDKYNGDKGKLSSFYSTISKFDFDRKVRDRTKIPSDTEIRNFFDDITLEYLHKKLIPSKKDLDKLYEKTCGHKLEQDIAN